MKTVSCMLLAACGVMLCTPSAEADSRRGGRGSTVTITYTYRVYGS